MTQLTLTVREEVASCMERAYKKLKLSDAQRMLMFDSPQATLDYCKKHEWRCSGDFITFEGAGAAASQSQHKEVPPLELINNTLVYAKELERIPPLLFMTSTATQVIRFPMGVGVMAKGVE
ncbi:PCI domain-containing protein, partial [Haematococcus lacustris]